ncbi:hypothetical protein, partial [Streptomyces sp. 4F14]|uniref:hypothetical protein n=1 Tax=Streptomyces sp. 4F14 TaxID=3394380 RepID=UPI003A873A21
MAVHAQSVFIRSALFDALAARWGGEPDIRDFIRSRVLTDPHQDARTAALGLLHELSPDDDDVDALIERCSVSDPSPEVRGLALSFRKDPETGAL